MPIYKVSVVLNWLQVSKSLGRQSNIWRISSQTHTIILKDMWGLLGLEHLYLVYFIRSSFFVIKLFRSHWVLGVQFWLCESSWFFWHLKGAYLFRNIQRVFVMCQTWYSVWMKEAPALQSSKHYFQSSKNNFEK